MPLLAGRQVITQPRERQAIAVSEKVLATHAGINIAVAGSYGKTTMKELLKTVLNQGLKVAATPANKNVSISHAYIGDRVTILPGAAIGQPGFGFASSPAGHVKIPQLGRVIIQDGVEIGAATTIDRGAIGDTVIGEGSKIDNLVQIGHNVQIGRHVVLVSQVGIAGSSTRTGDFIADRQPKKVALNAYKDILER